MKFKCKSCNWIGFQEECPVVTEPSPLLEEDAEPYLVCPVCKGTILAPLGDEIQSDT